jgi:rhodanese-related sulfurtransferase
MDNDVALKRTRVFRFSFVFLIIVGGIILGQYLYYYYVANNSPPENSEYTDLSVQDASAMMLNNISYPNLVILDVREVAEYNAGHIKNAINIPLHELTAKISSLETYKQIEIIVYCRMGYNSRLASQQLVDAGFSKVYNMVGGINAWNDAGYKTMS